MFKYIEHRIYFTYNIKNVFTFVDNFVLNEEFTNIRMNKLKHVEKRYKDKNTATKIKEPYEIAIFRKNRWIILYKNKGSMIISGDYVPEIPNLEMDIIEKIPVLTTYTHDFNLSIMLTVLGCMSETTIKESKNMLNTYAHVLWLSLKITIYDGLMVYRGSELETFKKLCETAIEQYNENYESLLPIFKKLPEPTIDKYKSWAYKTWYNAKRENQREWPLISKTKVEGSIEFPKDSGIFYYYPNKEVKLVKRNDFNSEIYIPKIYSKARTEIDVSINSKIRSKFKILPKNKIFKFDYDEPYTKIDWLGNIIESSENATALVYNDRKIGKIDSSSKNEAIQAQILDRDNKIEYKLIDGKWVKAKLEPKIVGVVALPYNYKQIIHDHALLNKLEKGPLMDLTNIGIVNPETAVKITFPDILNLYISGCLETERTCSFKYMDNVKVVVVQK